jgi:hypothetical protein
MRRLVLALLWLAVGLTTAAVVVFAVPGWRYRLLAWVRGEALYAGYPIGYWAGELEGGDESQRWTARLQLMSIGAPAVPYLLRALHSEDAGVRRDAAAGLDGLAPRFPLDEALPDLLAALADPDPHVRADAASALGYANKARAGDIVPALEQLQSDPERLVRWHAEAALDRFQGRLNDRE